MQYLRARYFNPATGTFNRLDPFAGNMRDPQSLHKYLYVHGDPIGGIDPLGLMAATYTMGGLSIMNMMVATVATTIVSARLMIGVRTGLLPQLIDDIRHLLGSTTQEIRETAALLLSHVNTVIDAMTDALVEAAQATDKTLERLRRLRMFPVVMSVMPHIYLHNVKCFALNKRWYVLNYASRQNSVGLEVQLAFCSSLKATRMNRASR